MSSVLDSADMSNTTLVATGSSTQSLDSLPTEEFLKVVGMRVRAQRSAKSMSRKKLAEVSGVSERYLAQLESGQGNMSIALLRKVTTAINLSLAKLLSAETPELLDPTESGQVAKADGEHYLPNNGYGGDDGVEANRRVVTGI